MTSRGATQAQHTPGPWMSQHTAGHDTHGQTAVYAETTGKDIAIVYDGEAHAQFIVRAVNSHADLLEALEGLLAHRECPINSPEADIARAAINKAKG